LLISDLAIGDLVLNGGLLNRKSQNPEISKSEIELPGSPKELSIFVLS